MVEPISAVLFMKVTFCISALTLVLLLIYKYIPPPLEAYNIF